MNTICPGAHGWLTDLERNRGGPLAPVVSDQLGNSLSCGFVHEPNYRSSYLAVNSFSYLPGYRDSYRFAG